jgi:hypothetical protein
MNPRGKVEQEPRFPGRLGRINSKARKPGWVLPGF